MSTSTLRVAMIGTAFMARAHSHAWRTAPRFFDLPVEIQPSVIVGTDPNRAEEAARKLGWDTSSSDWRDVVYDPDIDVVDVCTPGDTHAEMAIAALAAGKHVLCEKPLANSLSEAIAMSAAADRAREQGAIAMCGFSYRRTPALALAKRFVEDGRIGTIRHVRAQYLQDWLSDPEAPFTWRLDKRRAGSGSLGDIAAHSVDAAQWLTGQRIMEVSGALRTFVDRRPLSPSDGGPENRASVTVDDAAAFIARFSAGAMGVFEATRYALGRRNANRIEINGDRGSIAFDFERMNELQYYDGREPDDGQGFRRIHVTDPGHPYADHWWTPGHGLGYDHLFTNQIADFVLGIASGDTPSPTFDDALSVQRVLDAVERSASDRSSATAVNYS